MKRVGTVLKVDIDRLDEYKKLHREVWPGIIDMIKECNIKNYSIYYKDGFLFSYYEYTGNNYEEDMTKMSNDPLTQRWWEVCKPCQIPLETREKGEWWAEMEEVFHTG